MCGYMLTQNVSVVMSVSNGRNSRKHQTHGTGRVSLRRSVAVWRVYVISMTMNDVSSWPPTRVHPHGDLPITVSHEALHGASIPLAEANIGTSLDAL